MSYAFDMMLSRNVWAPMTCTYECLFVPSARGYFTPPDRQSMLVPPGQQTLLVPQVVKVVFNAIKDTQPFDGTVGVLVSDFLVSVAAARNCEPHNLRLCTVDQSAMTKQWMAHERIVPSDARAMMLSGMDPQEGKFVNPHGEHLRPGFMWNFVDRAADFSGLVVYEYAEGVPDIVPTPLEWKHSQLLASVLDALSAWPSGVASLVFDYARPLDPCEVMLEHRSIMTDLASHPTDRQFVAVGIPMPIVVDRQRLRSITGADILQLVRQLNSALLPRWSYGDRGDVWFSGRVDVKTPFSDDASVLDLQADSVIRCEWYLDADWVSVFIAAVESPVAVLSAPRSGVYWRVEFNEPIYTSNDERNIIMDAMRAHTHPPEREF